jgi:hypothetical protein
VTWKMMHGIRTSQFSMLLRMEAYRELPQVVLSDVPVSLGGIVELVDLSQLDMKRCISNMEPLTVDRGACHIRVSERRPGPRAR